MTDEDNAMDEALKAIVDEMVSDMPSEEVERAKLLTEMIEKLCTGESYPTVVLALAVAMRETFAEWANEPEDPDDPPPADDIPEEQPKTDLKLVS